MFKSYDTPEKEEPIDKTNCPESPEDILKSPQKEKDSEDNPGEKAQ